MAPLDMLQNNAYKPPFPLKRKLTFIVITMSVFAFVVYVPVAYKHSQTVLGNQLIARAHFSFNQMAARNIPLEPRETFAERVKEFTVGPNGYIVAIDSSGNFVTPHPRDLRHLKDDLKWLDQVKALTLDAQSEITSAYKDTRYVVAHSFGQYRLLSFINETDFLSELLPLLYKTILIGFIFVGVFFVLAYFFIKGITGPVGKVTAAAGYIARYHRPSPVRVATGDEIEILAAQITEMGRQIHSYEKNLEEQIAQRTSQLSETNIELKEKTVVLERVLEDVKKFDEELSRLNRAKSEFISMASHQLRTPLTAIKWHSKIVENEGKKRLTPAQRRAFSQIVNANERMIELINSLLNISRIEMGALAIEPKPISINEEIVAAIKTCKTLAQEHKVKVGHQLLPKITAQLDPHLLSIILNNLLVNAIRYTPKGGEVTAALSQKGNYAIITVSDTGYGIPLLEQKNIFNKFFRASNAVKQETTGTGLGLYLTKTLAEMMGGKINFTSQEGQGSTFKVTLPRTGLKKRVGARGLIPLST